jgi:tetratricopeptide (TPR) repeat protein
MACKVLGDLGAAEGALRRALALAPESGEAWHNLGSVLADVGGRMRDAIAAFDQAIALGHPAVAETRMSRALALLAAGDLKRGWEEIDVRLELSRWRGDVRPYCIPFWKGEPLEGRSILVWGEQGVGDELLYASLYAGLIAQVSACIIECRDKLVPLMQRSFPSARILTWRQPGDPGNAEGIDYQIPIASLGRYLRPTLGSFPVHDGYLRADPQRVAYWQRRLHGLGTGARIGFSWRSGDSSGERALACTDLSQWRCLFARASATFVCLQYDECAAEIEALRRAGHANVVRFPEVDYFDDLDEVAALMEALDLVVSAPNAVSIEAAALGVPTWQLGYGMDWQCLGTEANPWFPAMRRFERKWNESWDEVLQRVAENLDAFLSARPANARL